MPDLEFHRKRRTQRCEPAAPALAFQSRNRPWLAFVSVAVLAATLLTNADAIAVDGNPIGTVLGKTILESDLNPNRELGEELTIQFIYPLTKNYLTLKGIDPQKKLEKRIPDAGMRAAAIDMVRQRILQKDLYDRFGGRVQLSAFGPFAVDAYRKWILEREQLGEFSIVAMRHRKLLLGEIEPTKGALFSDNIDQIKSAFDPALIEHFIDSLGKASANANSKSPPKPVENLKVAPVPVPRKGLDPPTNTPDSDRTQSVRRQPNQNASDVLRIRQRTDVRSAVTRLRKTSSLDFGDGIENPSRRLWMQWWSYEQSNRRNASDGHMNYCVIGTVADSQSNPVVGATVRVRIPWENSPTGTYQMGHTVTDAFGNYRLNFGLPGSIRHRPDNALATVTAIGPRRTFVADRNGGQISLERRNSIPKTTTIDFSEHTAGK